MRQKALWSKHEEMEPQTIYLADRGYWSSRDRLSRGLLPTEIGDRNAGTT